MFSLVVFIAQWPPRCCSERRRGASLACLDLTRVSLGRSAGPLPDATRVSLGRFAGPLSIWCVCRWGASLARCRIEACVVGALLWPVAELTRMSLGRSSGILSIWRVRHNALLRPSADRGVLAAMCFCGLVPMVACLPLEGFSGLGRIATRSPQETYSGLGLIIARPDWRILSSFLLFAWLDRQFKKCPDRFRTSYLSEV